MSEQVTANELGIKIGSTVSRKNDYDIMREWEVTGIDPDGECIEIENEHGEYMYIMADDCILEES